MYFPGRPDAITVFMPRFFATSKSTPQDFKFPLAIFERLLYNIEAMMKETADQAFFRDTAAGESGKRVLLFRFRSMR